jgi:phosphoribosylformimino-5-aminoimidazole carboxamide ribotide isomerase
MGTEKRPRREVRAGSDAHRGGEVHGGSGAHGGDVILYPAIDMLDSKAVRLVKGDFEAKKVYDEDPLQAARRWVQEGAEELHVVDLDGARSGAPVNLEHVRRIVSELGRPVQLGGGLRTLQAIEDALQAGAERAILGTAAFTNPELLDKALKEWPGRVMVSVDTRGGRVTTAGWTETSEVTAQAVIRQLQERGVERVVYTNVDRDGMLEGPDVEEVKEIAQAMHSSAMVYSGGIGQLRDLAQLKALQEPNLTGVIVGKALYEERFTLADGRAVLGG